MMEVAVPVALQLFDYIYIDDGGASSRIQP